jgi:hypothetical protein
MKTIPLTNSDLVAFVDDADYDHLLRFTWFISDKGYAIGNACINGLYKTIRMHCVIMRAKGIDHRDTNRLNNQRANLRIATQSQNSGNQKILARKTHNSKSKYKGVSWSSASQKWRTQIVYMYKHIHLGYFHNEQEAAKAYNAKAIELFGEFARINEV